MERRKLKEETVVSEQRTNEASGKKCDQVGYWQGLHLKPWHCRRSTNRGGKKEGDIFWDDPSFRSLH